MNNYIGEFKKFINRGNVVDMSVGVIVGSAFTAIVTAMSNNILKPIVNFFLATLFDADSLHEIYTYLKPVYADVLDEAGNVIGQEIDLAQSIYIDWGAFINAVINFFLIALVLFTIVKFINKVRVEQKEFAEKMAEKTLDRKERKELKAHGIKIRDKAAVEAYFAEKKRLAAEAAAKAKAEEEEKARIEREKNPTAEDLLKKILEVISK
ncbi:MAG: large conductance mechanosensitive channel protein MscL [Clostridia bacterium]|nr:large conductance mechanosensitive channel protein MscL [Clostridia bacterium]MBQ3227146.1 large conductance mechanosensitive channel protein MscL [Clostridia bacterium]MBR4062725.1 large conductance mechanosensitive channel protein MscL [Clostridia bacterium]